MIRGALVGALLALGCGPLPLEPFTLDVSANCNEVVVDEIYGDLIDDEWPWTRVHDAAMDGPESDGAWLLVETELLLTGTTGLAVVHIDGDTVVIVDELDVTTFTDDISLVAGPDQGDMWLVEKGERSFRLRSYEASPQPTRLFVSNDFASSFPNPMNCLDENGFFQTCDWPRELVFLQGIPHLLTIPPSSDDSSIDVMLAGVSPDLAYLTNVENLNFDNKCEDEDLTPEELALCEAHKGTITHPRVEPIGVQIDTRTATTTVALYRETLDDLTVQPMTDLALVVLGVNSQGRASGTLLSDPGISIPTTPMGEVAVDTRAAYVRYMGYEEALVQFSLLTKKFALLTGEAAPLEDKTLLQLDEDVALGRIVDGVWEVTKLFPDAPQQSRVTMHDPGGGLRSVTQAGPGAFVLHSDVRGPDLVRVRCSDTAPVEP